MAATGPDALEEFDRNGADIVLLDLMLPGLPGTEVCRRLRQVSPVPVIVVSAKDTEIDKVVGLELGADDYVTKPYCPRELVARIRAVLRRGTETADPSSRRRSSPDRCAWTSTGTSSPSTAPTCGCRSRSSSCWRCSCATPAGCSPGASSSTGCGARTTSATPRRSTSTSSGSGRRSSPTPRTREHLVTVRGLGYKYEA